MDHKYNITMRRAINNYETRDSENRPFQNHTVVCLCRIGVSTTMNFAKILILELTLLKYFLENVNDCHHAVIQYSTQEGI